MANPKPIPSQAEESLAAHFADLPEADPLREARAAAFAAIRENGLPHRRVEDWKYTDLRNLMGEVPAPAGPAEAEDATAALGHADTFEGIERARIVFANGQFVPSLSDMKGLEDQIEFASLGRFLANGGTILEPFQGTEAIESPIHSLNTAFVSDGAVLRIKPGVRLPRPIEIVSIYCDTTPGLQTLRHQIEIGEDAEATILLTSYGPDDVGYHSNILSEVRIGDHAKLNWIAAREEGDASLHLNLILPRLGKEAAFDPFLFNMGGALARTEMRLEFQGEDATAGIRGATISRDRQHGDITLFVDHAVPGCASREYFKSALDGEARGVFQGRILVRPHAQKTDGQMMSQALLLSDRAEFDNKPELEIFADDVTCAHGATCGDIDEDMLFFMRSRGIGLAEAEQLLVQAFLAEVIEEIDDEEIASLLEARTWKWLAMRSAR